MGATLDRKRPYGTVSGCLQGRAFEQDNLFFNGDGSQWVEPAAQPEPAPPEEDAPKPKPVIKPAKAKS